MQQRLAEKEKLQKEEHLRALAQRAREERSRATGSRADSRARSYSRSRSRGSYSSRSERSDSEDDTARDRMRARRERQQENERQLRQSRMGTERRIQMMAREQNRDISEKVALGLAKPTQAQESMYDSRLFNQTSGFDSGFNEDQAYDKPLFAAQDAISSIYRPKASGDDEEYNEEAAAGEMGRIQKGNRFDVLGRAEKGFKGADVAEAREGPVQFEKDKDPFGIDSMIAEAAGGSAAAASGSGSGGAGSKRYGISSERDEDDSGRGSKRARVDEDDYDDR